MKKPVVLIIGAGPAGLTAALELARDGRMMPVVLEASDSVGGISRTITYKGNRMDIGGHRFFSKSDWVMNWWNEILPISASEKDVEIAYQGRSRKVNVDVSDADKKIAEGKMMLVRDRLSRIYFLRRYFDYPVKINKTTFLNLGFIRLVKIGFSYCFSMVFPRRKENSLEDFFINRFGGELYRTFFKDYTEKVWGVSCDRISAEWGAQRIKGLSILEAIRHAWRRLIGAEAASTKTSLIEKFLYPRLGPGQLWEEVARQVVDLGGEIRYDTKAVSLSHDGHQLTGVRVLDGFGVEKIIEADYFISTMPVKDLVSGMTPRAPVNVGEIANALPYRDFITVGLLLSKMRSNSQARSTSGTNMPADNWIYIQERDVRIGRLQVFNNWSPDLVADSEKVWLGLEYFCQEGDDLWSMSDEQMHNFAIAELEKIGLIDRSSVLDGTVVRVPKTYPAYFGAYKDFSVVREWLDGFENLYLVGRNGMHRYNNQDHSMLTAKLAVEAILSGSKDKSNIWSVNIDDEYHEEAKR